MDIRGSQLRSAGFLRSRRRQGLGRNLRTEITAGSPALVTMVPRRSDEWRPLQRAHLSESRLDVPAVVGESLQMDISLTPSVITPNASPFEGSQTTTLPQLNTAVDPCELFTAAHLDQVMTRGHGSLARLSLTSAVRAEDESMLENHPSHLSEDGLNPYAGHLPLHSLRVTSADPERDVEILAVSYRVW